MYKEDKRPVGVLVGRFEPFHLGHKGILDEAIEKYQKVVIVLGSAREAPTVKNPFCSKMRERMIRSCVDEQTNQKLYFVTVRDSPYNDGFWLADVRNKVLRMANCSDHEVDLVGHFKDKSSYYLKQFPLWGLSQCLQQAGGISATQVRELLFVRNLTDLKSYVCPSVYSIIEEYTETTQFQSLQDEYDYLTKYKADTKFVKASFAPTFHTVDAVLVQNGHVLLVKRKFNPGKGLYALPGGFIQPEETLKEAVVRELKEETKIKITKTVLSDLMQNAKYHIFDAPERSLRGRTITTAFFLNLSDHFKHDLPYVSGDDDAEEAFWFPVADLVDVQEEMFEDHLHIIQYFTRSFN